MSTLQYSPVAPSGSYRAPVARRRIDHKVALPGSKSLTNRELVLAALADAPSRLHHPLHARDTQLMASALQSLGAIIEEVPGDGAFGPDFQITPLTVAASAGETVTIDCGLAGTVMRFIPPLALLGKSSVTITGDEQASARPMGPIIQALRQLGADVDDGGRESLPFTISPSALPSTMQTVRIDASRSSQFVSGLLLAAARFPGGLTIEHTGDRLPSVPHIEMTIETLRQHGVTVMRDGTHRFVVPPQVIHATSPVIEPDLSNAAPFLASVLVAGGSVRLVGWPEQTTQVGAEVPGFLEHFGALVSSAPHEVTVTAPGLDAGPLRAVNLDLHEAGELAPTLVSLAVFADGPSHFTGIGHLRGHETDRLHALKNNIENLGGAVEELPDGLIVTPRPLHGGQWKAWGDHRMATSGALIGLAVEGVVIDDIGQTAKTLPEFVDLWESMLA